jgi:predicted transcriptional regulator
MAVTDPWGSASTLTVTTGTGSSSIGGWYGNFVTESGAVEMTIKKDRNIPAKLYFKLVKNKLSKIDAAVLEKKLQKLEKATEKLIDQGQNLLAEKFLNNLTIATKELQLYTAGVRYYIDKDVLWKHKHKIRGGHISNTKYEDFMRKIPEDVVEAKAKVEDIFDEFWIFHYYSKETEMRDEKKLSPVEKSRMKDPILFGVIKETERFYLVADWIDEECDLTFDQMIEAIAGEEDELEYKLSGTPTIEGTEI